MDGQCKERVRYERNICGARKNNWAWWKINREQLWMYKCDEAWIALTGVKTQEWSVWVWRRKIGLVWCSRDKTALLSGSGVEWFSILWAFTLRSMASWGSVFFYPKAQGQRHEGMHVVAWMLMFCYGYPHIRRMLPWYIDKLTDNCQFPRCGAAPEKKADCRHLVQCKGIR